MKMKFAALSAILWMATVSGLFAQGSCFDGGVTIKQVNINGPGSEITVFSQSGLAPVDGRTSEPIGSLGSRFELYVSGQESQGPLDTVFVSALNIDATLDVKSRDVVNDKRTRVSVPYSVIRSIKGLDSTQNDVSLMLVREATLDSSRFPFAIIPPDPIQVGNGDGAFDVPPDPRFIPNRSEERWFLDYISTPPTSGSRITQSPTMFVFPDTDVQLKGLEGLPRSGDGTIIFRGPPSQFPDVRADLINLYPNHRYVVVLERPVGRPVILAEGQFLGKDVVVSQTVRDVVLNIRKNITVPGPGYKLTTWQKAPINPVVSLVPPIQDLASPLNSNIWGWEKLPTQFAFDFSFNPNVQGSVITK